VENGWVAKRKGKEKILEPSMSIKIKFPLNTNGKLYKVVGLRTMEHCAGHTMESSTTGNLCVK
jgi:hypothetical protein